MFHLACNLLRGESDTTSVALPYSPYREATLPRFHDCWKVDPDPCFSSLPANARAMYCSRSSASAARAAPPMDASRTKLHHDQAFVHGDSPIGTNGMKVNILPWLPRSPGWLCFESGLGPASVR